MILRRLKQRLATENWIAVVIELLIVIVGVFIGTQVSNWNQDRIAGRETREMLVELKPGLQSFVDFFRTAKDYYRITGQYAGTAFSGWRGDPHTSDEQFVISAYQASQIYILGVNAVNWTRIFGGDRLDHVSDPALHNHLANLMTLNFDQIDTPAISTQYREHVRQQIPDDIQDAIRKKCGDQPIQGMPLTQRLSASCDLDFPPARWAEAARTLRQHPELAGELRWHRSAVATFLTNMLLFEQETGLIMARMDQLGL